MYESIHINSNTKGAKESESLAGGWNLKNWNGIKKFFYRSLISLIVWANKVQQILKINQEK